jgi:predicted nicotinamide N-methyase
MALNGTEADVAAADWDADGDALVERGPFDLVLGADVLYTKENAHVAMRLLPRLIAPGGKAWFADPGRSNSADFIAAIKGIFSLKTRREGELSMYELTPR